MELAKVFSTNPGSCQERNLHSARAASSLLCRCSTSAAAQPAEHGRPQKRSSVLRQGLQAGALSALALQLNTPEVQAATEPSPILNPGPGQVAMRTLPGSELAIGFYPRFIYDSSGGGGIARASQNGSSKVNLVFDPASVTIPDVTGKSTTFLSVPLLPYLRIAIKPTRLEGTVNRDTGEVELFLDAEFRFNAGSLYNAPPLLVETRLTSESVTSRHHSRQGSRMDNNGFATLTGVADIAQTGDPLLDNFLLLPTDVLAVMKSQFAFQVSR